ncbi:MAG: mechanosensitive ion channel family protein [Proteobacteria bacterium]|nr:mechanosensitive ion channel family protein [Pseudomonadota bacterium]MBU4470631.1 mechanosensitive ion channel family protein [Pseudomonadota bacterium]
MAAFFVKRTPTVSGEAFLKQWRGPSRLIFPLFMVHLALPLITLSSGATIFFKQIFALLFIGSIGWLIIRSINVFEAVILDRFQVNVTDNLHARKIHTQIRVLKRVAIILVGFLALVAILMTFERIRYLGTSILASAGIAGIIVGFAAQRSIATLLAGIQVAITQPIRLDDVVIVENEWGRIEEITLTYVVVNLWDERRLIVPITHFLEKPFQNWTRVSAQLVGTVFLYVDYTAPVEAIRNHLHDIVKSTDLWDGRVCVLQVTHAGERTVELRALVSAGNASTAWTLRCLVREKLISFCKENFPMALPKFRTEPIAPEPMQNTMKTSAMD